MRPFGVSNMSSVCVGIQRIIKKESPLVVYVQCGGRCLNLAIARSCCSQEHYFLHCQNNLSFRTTLMNDLNNINTAIASLNSNDLLRVILYGDESFNKETNCKILTASTKRFEKSLF